MTVPIPCPPPAANAPAFPPRKRRRRAPASGATADCFACTKLQVKCDRRRPYCSQCLEKGNECSGYKTQLTWGVGVASRGKLRGLSLPIAKSAPAHRSPPAPRPRAISTASRRAQSIRDAKAKNDEDVDVKLEVSTPLSSHPYTSYDFVNMAPSPTSMMTLPSSNSDWQLPLSQDFSQIHNMSQHDGTSNSTYLRQSLHRLHSPSLSQSSTMGMSSADSLSAYSGSDYASPTELSYTPEDLSYLASPMPMYSRFPCQTPLVDSPTSMMHSRGPTSYPEPYYAQSDMSSSISSHHTGFDNIEVQALPSSPAGRACNIGDAFYDDDLLGRLNNHGLELGYDSVPRPPQMNWPAIVDEENASGTELDVNGNYSVQRSHVSPQAPASAPVPQMTPRISFFMDYYEKIICPSIVVIDSPDNPYREQILALAHGSESLQHAICALAACNLRMKRKQSLNQGPWQTAQHAEFQDRINNRGSQPPSEPNEETVQAARTPGGDDASVQEEHQHRALAVQLLNQQLSDPVKAKHDSVLATLFILCHYRMCESGTAQFQTQFAGVKKLMGMRQSGTETGKWGWMETLFTYFDSLAATVNDREAQLRGGYLDMVASPMESGWAIENLAGCDGRLFKIIAKLGRLNLLSQHRAVLDPLDATKPAQPLPTPRPRLAGQALVDFYNMNNQKFDGNGFSSTIDDESLSQNFGDEFRPLFWQEWKEMRAALQSWEFDPQRLVAILSFTPTSTQLRDFSYISEAFRYAAILYTERLAMPHLPSSHLNFQNLVSQVLFYVTSLEENSGAEKFLLWPLFIAGSEATTEFQRAIVAGKIGSIGSRSGYQNNRAGLDVLERIWSDTNETNNGSNMQNVLEASGIRGPFKWTKFMDGLDGEAIMI